MLSLQISLSCVLPLQNQTSSFRFKFFIAAIVLQCVCDRALQQRASSASGIHWTSLTASRVFHGSFQELLVQHSQRVGHGWNPEMGRSSAGKPTQRRDGAAGLFQPRSAFFSQPTGNRGARDGAARLPRAQG